MNSSNQNLPSNLRRSQRICQSDKIISCYKEYSNTGKKDSKSNSNVNASSSSSIIVMSSKGELHIQHEILLEDIHDYIDENVIDDSTTVTDDIDMYVTKLEQLRTKFRSVHKSLLSVLQSLMCVAEESYDVKYRDVYNETMSNIKGKITSAKTKRSEIRSNQDNAVQEEKLSKNRRETEESLQKQRTAEFLITEINRYMDELGNEFDVEIEQISDEELMRRKKDLSRYFTSFSKLFLRIMKK